MGNLLSQSPAGKEEFQARRRTMNNIFIRMIRSLHRALAYREETANAFYGIACIYSLQGKKRLALQFLEKSLQEGFKDMDKIERNSDLRTIRDNYRRKNLIERHT
jgi:hypothetical protein